MTPKAEFEILENNNYKKLFLDKWKEASYGYISYRLFIAYAMWQLIKDIEGLDFSKNQREIKRDI